MQVNVFSVGKNGQFLGYFISDLPKEEINITKVNKDYPEGDYIDFFTTANVEAKSKEEAYIVTDQLLQAYEEDWNKGRIPNSKKIN